MGAWSEITAVTEAVTQRLISDRDQRSRRRELNQVQFIDAKVTATKAKTKPLIAARKWPPGKQVRHLICRETERHHKGEIE